MTAMRHNTAFTLVELLVVIGVIALLIGAILGVSVSVIAGAKARDTQAMLASLSLAVDQFRNDAPLAKATNYKKRYLENAPPDELEAFTGEYTESPVSVAPGAAALQDGSGGALSLSAVEHRDIKAMVLAMTLYSDAAAAILDRIDTRFRRRAQDAAGAPTEVLRRSMGGSNIDIPLVYYVDSWGTPLDYFATSDTTGAQAFYDTVPINNARRDTSTALLRINNGEPLFVSYGPDGPEQFSADFYDPADDLPYDLVYDWTTYTSDAGFSGNRIDHPLNADNVYSDPQIAERLATGAGGK